MEEKFETVINSHKSLSHVEIEMRLGHTQGARFDTNIGEKDFKWIMSGLRKYDNWSSIKETTNQVYYEGNIRHTIDQETDNEVCIEKIKIKNIDHRADKFDVRLAVAQELPHETPLDEVAEFDRCVIKNRISFVRKNVSIDLTVVTGDPDDLDDEEEKQYQVELEILNVNDLSKDDLVNSIHKIINLMDMFKR